MVPHLQYDKQAEHDLSIEKKTGETLDLDKKVCFCRTQTKYPGLYFAIVEALLNISTVQYIGFIFHTFQP